MEKIAIIDEHIEMCKKSLEEGNEEQVFNEILPIYRKKIKKSKKGFTASHFATSSTGSCNYTADIKLLIRKIEFYKAELLDQELKEKRKENQKYELEKLRLQAEISKNNFTVNNNNANNNENNLSSTITITLDQTIGEIDKLPSDVLSKEDKEKLQNDLYALEGIKATKNKSKFWDKAKEVIGILVEKGANAAIAATPYIIQTLSQM